MTIQLTAAGLRQMLPRAPQDVLDAFLANQDQLTKAGVNHTRTRLAYFFANIEHETDGFTIRNLTENINYTAPRAAQIWPSRFPGGAAQVRAKYGTAPGWQLKMFDDVYGNRMGNRPGTHDGSRYIGRGGPQWTGREGYEALQARTGLPAVEQPETAARHDKQPEVCAAFWSWKGLNSRADVGDFVGCVKRWNGGTIGLADRKARLAGNDRAIDSFPDVDRIAAVTKTLPGAPPTAEPPKEVVDAATEEDRNRAKAGGVVTVGGGAGKAIQTSTEQPDKPAMPFIASVALWAAIGVGVVIVVVAAIEIVRKKAAVAANWN